MLAVINPTGAPIRSLTVEANAFRVELYDAPARPSDAGSRAAPDEPLEAADVPYAGAQPYEPAGEGEDN